MPAWAKEMYMHRAGGGAGRGPLYGNYSGQGTLGTAQLASDTFWCSPFVMPESGALDQLVYQVTGPGAAGSKYRFAIYANQKDDTLFPSKLIVETGEQDGTSVGVKTIIPANQNPGYVGQFLDAGLYWAVFYCGPTGTQPVMAAIVAQMATALLGFNNTPVSNFMVSVPLTYVVGAALPSVMPVAGAAYSTLLPPWFSFRLSA